MSLEFTPAAAKRKFGDGGDLMTGAATPFSSSKHAVKMVRVLKKELRQVGRFMDDEARDGNCLSAKVLHNGDVAVIRPETAGRAMLAQYGGALHSYMPRCTYTVVPGDHDDETANVHIDVFIDALGRSTETMVCDEGGNMWIKVEEEDGHSSSFEYTVGLKRDRDENESLEIVTCIEHVNASTSFIGTSNMSVYYIKHAHGGRVLQCRSLQQSARGGLLGSILMKGTDLLVGKLFGGGAAATKNEDDRMDEDTQSSAPVSPGTVGEEGPSHKCISRNGRTIVTMRKRSATFGCIAIIPLVGAGSRLLAVGSTLKMWSGYDEPGREQLEWSWDLFPQVFDALQEETGESSSSLQVGLAQVDLVPIHPGASSASLLILALSASPSSAEASLWLLRVVVPLRSRATPLLRECQLVATNVGLETALCKYTPALHARLEPPIADVGGGGMGVGMGAREGDFSGEVLVTWVGQNSSSKRPPSLYCSLIDAAAIGGRGEAAGTSIASAVNCEVSASQLLTVSTVDGEEDLVALLTNGTLLRIMPSRSLRRHGAPSSTGLLGTPGGLLPSSEAATSATPGVGSIASSKADVIRVLVSRCRHAALTCKEEEANPFSPSFNQVKGACVSEESLALLQHAFASMSSSETVDTVSAVALQLINRDPPDAAGVGGRGVAGDKHSRNRSGSDSGRQGLHSSQQAELVRIRDLMQRRVAAFYCFVRVLEEVGLLSMPDPASGADADAGAGMEVDGAGVDAQFAFSASAVSAIQLSVGEWEQSLLGATGLAISLHDLASRGLADGDGFYGDADAGGPLLLGNLGGSSFSTGESLAGMCARFGLRALSVGMTAASDERQSSSSSMHDFPAAHFFAEVDSIGESLHRVVLLGLGHTTRGSGSGSGLPSFAAALGVLQAMLAAVRAAHAGPGAASDASALLCSQGARAGMLLVLDSLIAGIDSAALNAWSKESSSSSSSSSSGGAGLRGDVRDFCVFALESYALEAECKFFRGRTGGIDQEGETPRYGRYMPAAWKDRFRECQKRVNKLMLLLTSPQEAFSLARTYLDFHGMKQASDAAITQLIPELAEVCQAEGLSMGTEEEGLLEFMLESYENAEGDGLKPRRALYLFELGRAHPQVLERFLSTRPHLDWPHRLTPGSAKSFSRGAASSYAQLQSTTSPESAQVLAHIDNRMALASISKLSALMSLAQSQGQGEAGAGTTGRDADGDVYLAAEKELSCASLQKVLGQLLGDPVLSSAHREPALVVKTALGHATSMMTAKEGSGEAILATIHRILGLCLDLLRCSFPSEGQAFGKGDSPDSDSVEAWRQHVADVWTCSLQCQSALWASLGKELGRGGEHAPTPTDDDVLAIRGTVFHQLITALVLPDDRDRDHGRAVDISPDLPVILAAMKVQRSVVTAIETAIGLPPPVG